MATLSPKRRKNGHEHNQGVHLKGPIRSFLMSLVQSNITDINSLKRENKLESDRGEVLRVAAQGGDLHTILNMLCEKSEAYNPAMKSSVLRLNEKASTLHPLASVSLPQSYCDALEGVTIGVGVGSCGTAAFTKQRVIVEDINTHPYWAQYKGLALGAGLQACWSEPIKGANDRVYGTFAMYFDTPKNPTQEDISFIETSANLAAVIFENHQARQDLTDANHQLSQTVDERNVQLQAANLELSNVLKQQTIDNRNTVNSEKAVTTRMLIMGVAHEINTPLGIALTATSYSNDLVAKFMRDINEGKLTKLNALKSLQGISDSLALASDNLGRTSGLISKFKEIDSSISADHEQWFDMAEFLQELEHEVRSAAKGCTLKFEADEGISCHSRISLLQVFNHLVENSVVHGFEGKGGVISIHVTKSEQGIKINYQDDGKGLTQEQRVQVFEPFFSTQRTSGNIGLGLNVVNNIVNNVFKGEMKLIDSPVGVRYHILFT